MTIPAIPEAPKSIQKGVPLKLLLDKNAIGQLAKNLTMVLDRFDSENFKEECLQDIEPIDKRSKPFFSHPGSIEKRPRPLRKKKCG